MSNSQRPEVGGALFNIMNDGSGVPTMKWHSSWNKSKPFFPPDVLKFCCDKVLPILKDPSQVMGFTEHNRYDHSTDTNYLFRSHPSYRSDTGQLNAVWMDWALFQADDMQIPCQLLCFIVLTDLKNGSNIVQGYEIQSPGSYAIVRRMTTAPKNIPDCNFVTRGRLMDDLFLYETDTIISDIAVVPDLDEDGRPGLDFLAITNRTGWLDYFRRKNRSMNSISYDELYDDCTLTDDEASDSMDCCETSDEENLTNDTSSSSSSSDESSSSSDKSSISSDESSSCSVAS